MRRSTLVRSVLCSGGLVPALLLCASPAFAGPTAECVSSGNATSCGTGSQADGNSTAVGVSATAEIGPSTAVGANAFAFGINNAVLGSGATANVSSQTAVGGGAMARVTFRGEGTNATVLGVGSGGEGGFGRILIGNGIANTPAIVLGQGGSSLSDAIVAGGTTSYTGGASIVLGEGAFSDQGDAIVLGTGSTTSAANVLSVGSATNQRRITNVAAGIDATDAVTMAQLDAESQARIIDDLQLVQDLAAAATGRSQGDIAINTRIAAEEIARAQLGVAVQNEASVRAAADQQLSADLAAETAARANADAAITQRIADEETARTRLAADLQAAAGTRLAADLALSSRLDSVSARLDGLRSDIAALETSFVQLDRRIDAATALAVALGGNAFLPGTKINITANFGAYNGSTAAALQMSFLLAERLVLTAGSAIGLSDRVPGAGRTAAQVGLNFAI